MTELDASSSEEVSTWGDPDVVVRAIRRTPEGIGVYDRHAPILVKNLRAAGAVVEYEDPPDTRRFLDENSAVEVIAAALALNALRSALREYYPAALQAFDDLHDRDALAVLGRAPARADGARLTIGAIRSALKHAGRRRNLDQRAAQIQTALRTEQLIAPGPVTAAFAATTRAALGIIAALNQQITELETQLNNHFEQHPDADIYLSLPGLGDVLGARVLGEFGDDPDRYTTAKSRKNYAGTSPLTIASGKKRAVLARHVRNRRLYDAIDQWAFCSLSASPGARAFYDQHRATGDLHHQALRALGNRLVGILHGCLHHHTHYNEHTAWSHRTQDQQAAA